MNRLEYLIASTARLLEFLQSRPLRWYLLLLIVVAAGPFGVDFVVLFDLVMTVGVDVFVLFLLYYTSAALRESYTTWIGRFRRLFAPQGDVVPLEQCLASGSSVALYLGHNLCVLVTPARFVTLAFVCLGIGPALALSAA